MAIPKRSRSAVYKTDYHLVFNTKYRKSILQGKIAQKVEEIILAVASKKRWEIRELKIMPNHVHLLISIPPQEIVANAVKQIKGVSSRCLFMEFPELRKIFKHNHLWAPSYFVRTTGNVTMGTVKKYIQNQKENG